MAWRRGTPRLRRRDWSRRQGRLRTIFPEPQVQTDEQVHRPSSGHCRPMGRDRVRRRGIGAPPQLAPSRWRGWDLPGGGRTPQRSLNARSARSARVRIAAQRPAAASSWPAAAGTRAAATATRPPASSAAPSGPDQHGGDQRRQLRRRGHAFIPELGGRAAMWGDRLACGASAKAWPVAIWNSSTPSA